MYIRHFIAISVAAVLLTSCQEKKNEAVNVEEDSQSKSMLQGLWVDDETAEVMFKVKGDTIYYPDSTSLPAYFKIVGDTLVMGSKADKYPVTKLTQNIFWFRNQNGDEVRLVRSSEPSDSLAFGQRRYEMLQPKTVVKSDTVVMHGGERYHYYIAVNPTSHKVVVTDFSDDGVGVDKVYFDNIIHISVYHGAKKIYSSDVGKAMYSNYVPSEMLSRSILSNMAFNRVDARGFHFDATICKPDGASCYLLDTNISFDGKLSMETIEY